MRRVVGILTALALTLTAASAFAVDSMNNSMSEDGLSPVFLRTDNSAPGSAVDEAAWANGTPLATSRRHFELGRKLSFAMDADQNGDVATSPAMADNGAEKKNPGRALLLSAIMPGAGELYAGSKLKAAAFFALELGCWYGAVSYAQRGNDKTTDFENFAEGHWTESIYRDLEYSAAVDQNAGSAYQGTPDEWNSLSWGEKIDYLPGNFTHELPDRHNQQYYENVGKYLTQFGFGWDDQTGDNPNTTYLWDGTSRHANQYVDMRYEANQYLDHSATFFSVIMVNHVLSALDAGFTVRSHNRQLAQVEPEAHQILHNDRPIAVAGLNVRF